MPLIQTVSPLKKSEKLFLKIFLDPVRFSFSDNLGTTQADRINLAKLFDNDYKTTWTSGLSTNAGTAEFEVTVQFVGDVTLNKLTLVKGGNLGAFDSTYKNACVALFDSADQAVGSPVCADIAHGMTGQDNTQATIEFDTSGESTNAVSYAKLSFDTTGGTGNGGATVDVKGLDMEFVPTA